MTVALAFFFCKYAEGCLGADPYILYFRVKFYVQDPSKLQEELTRYFVNGIGLFHWECVSCGNVTGISSSFK